MMLMNSKVLTLTFEVQCTMNNLFKNFEMGRETICMDEE